MYEFVRGPLVWLAFLVFVLGSIYQVVSIILLAKKDKVVYPYMNLKFSLRSIIHWVIPLNSRNMRKRFIFTILSFVFHFCLVVTPLFVLGHVLSFKESWGFSWFSLPEPVSNAMTITVLIIGLILLIRRAADPTVRIVSTWIDYAILLLVISPFFTGFLAYYQAYDYETMLILHIVSGSLWLIAIPFTRLSHMLFFVLTRAYMGSEFGYVRNSRDW